MVVEHQSLSHQWSQSWGDKSHGFFQHRRWKAMFSGCFGLGYLNQHGAGSGSPGGPHGSEEGAEQPLHSALHREAEEQRGQDAAPVHPRMDPGEGERSACALPFPGAGIWVILGSNPRLCSG